MHSIDFRKVIPLPEQGVDFNISDKNYCDLEDGYYAFIKSKHYPDSSEDGSGKPLRADGPVSGRCRKVANFKIEMIPIKN